MVQEGDQRRRQRPHRQLVAEDDPPDSLALRLHPGWGERRWPPLAAASGQGASPPLVKQLSSQVSAIQPTAYVKQVTEKDSFAKKAGQLFKKAVSAETPFLEKLYNKKYSKIDVCGTEASACATFNDLVYEQKFITTPTVRLLCYATANKTTQNTNINDKATGLVKAAEECKDCVKISQQGGDKLVVVVSAFPDPHRCRYHWNLTYSERADSSDPQWQNS